MGLFGGSKEAKERKKIERRINKLMNSYGKEKISGDKYYKKMMKLAKKGK